jgi:hypothetical protein
VVEDSSRTQKVLGAFNSTFLTLITKKESPTSFNDIRPISLFHCIYKIIAKIIVDRVKKIFSKTISKENFGFLHGRQIHEAIGVAQESLHYIKTQRLKAMVMKLDLSKAYNRTNWLYFETYTDSYWFLCSNDKLDYGLLVFNFFCNFN